MWLFDSHRTVASRDICVDVLSTQISRWATVPQVLFDKRHLTVLCIYKMLRIGSLINEPWIKDVDINSNYYSFFSLKTLEFLAWMFSQMDIKLLTSVLRFIEWLKELKISLETRYSHKGKWKLFTFTFYNTFKKKLVYLNHPIKWFYSRFTTHPYIYLYWRASI